MFAVISAIPLTVAAELGDPPAPILVTVDGVPTLVAHDATLGAVIDERSLRPAAGRLLDVDGRVLDRRADPGEIRLNGSPAGRRAPLEPGDEITVVDGRDRTEGTRRVVEILPGRQIHDPAYTLIASRVRRVVTVGRVSGKVADVRYEPVGRATRPPAVALTFDDGPWPRTTPQVLRILRRMDVPATFFMIGYLIERYPDIVERVARSGMTIGTHSWSHPYRTRFVDLTPHRIETEIERPAALLRERFGIDPTLFRPPGGSYDASVVRIAGAAGMRLVQWSVDPGDYRAGTAPGRIAAAVLRAVRPGSIVLLHDGGGDGRATVRALPRIIRGIRRMGLDLVAVPADPPPAEPG